MKKVTRTKVPTLAQLTNITINLQTKFGGNPCTTLAVLFNNIDGIFYSFSLHPGDERCFIINSWENLLSKYFELMEEPDALNPSDR